MGHKTTLDGRFSVVLSGAQPCLALVAIDQRAVEIFREYGVPGWLQEYSPTGHKLATDDPVMAEVSAEYLIFVRQAPAGRIVLGAPCMDGDYNAMYFAFFAEARSEADRK